jgi:UDP:flavonoid glycosyltransferase YjiC (YdhE family)
VSQRPVAVFSMPDRSHFQRLRPLVSALAAEGVPVCVFTDQKFQADVELAGGTFVDLFTKYPLESADTESMPMPSRLVTYAGHYADRIVDDLRAVDAGLVIHDTFAVAGWVAADLAAVPRVNVCSGHNIDPARFLQLLETDPRVNLSPRCLAAVDRLRCELGVIDASPFSYVAGLSRDLNIYAEPPEFLGADDRRVFEPLAFFGSIVDETRDGTDEPLFPSARGRTVKVYISFGTVVWRYFTAQALRALRAIADWFATVPEADVLVSLGGANVSAEDAAALSRPNVRVEPMVDQWRVLTECDVFVTHQGLNSTHEAIFHRVPMISYPFFWDQPELSERCHRFGIALPLGSAPQANLSPADVGAVWARFERERAAIGEALEVARGWELAVIAQRPKVIERVRALCLK